MGKPSVALVSVHYYPDYQRRNLREIRRLKGAIAIDRHVGVLNASRNLIPGDTDRHGVEWVQHDNVGQEFGAYQRGLDALLEGERPDWVIFMNDTLGTHTRIPSGVLTRLHQELDKPRSTLPVAVGLLDGCERSMQIGGHRGHRWIRTHTVALNDVALRALEDRIRVGEIDSLISGGDTEESFFAAECEPALKLHLLSWLFQPDGWSKWYRAACLTSDNCGPMARKARSIMQEFYLSFRLESACAIFIDLRAATTLGKLRDRIETEWFFRTTPGSIRQAG